MRPARRSLAPAVLALAALALAGHDPARAQDEDGGPTLALGGDVIFDGPILYAIDRFHGDAPEPALRELLSELAPSLGTADLAVVNLECPVAPRAFARDAEHDAPTFAAPPALLDALAASGVDALTLANNHAYDQGVGGLASTLAHARDARLATIGAGDDADDAARPVVLEARGRRIAFVAFTEGTNRRVREGDPASPRIAMASEGTITRSVIAARAGAALVIASLHWTSPPDDRPSRTMRRLARAAAEAGADLVYAHGPHLPAPRGTIATADGRRVPVLWSLGNLVAVMEAREAGVHAAAPSVRDAVIARVRTRRREGGALAVASIEAEAYWIATPQRAWWTSPTSAMVRPLSVDAELARLEAAQCGARCDRYAQSYRARRRMIASLFERATPHADAAAEEHGAFAASTHARSDAPGRDVEAAQAAAREAIARPAARADEPQHGTTPTRRDEPQEGTTPARRDATQDGTTPARRAEQDARARAERDAPRSSRRATGHPPPRPAEPAPAVPPELARGTALRVEFAHGASTLGGHDRDQIHAIAALLRADRSLRVEIVARPARDEPTGALAIQRAHRAAGLIAILGPSRSRFSLRAGPPAERAEITVRLAR